MRLHYEMVSASLIQVLRDLMKLDVLMNFRLVGGTSLALQLGHRNSVDIDLFGAGNTPPSTQLADVLSRAFEGTIKIIQVQPYGLTAAVNEIKIDIYDWEIPFIFESVLEDGIRMATVEDIFAYKCEAILGRKAEKDFVDIAEIALIKPLKSLLEIFQRRYPQYYKSAVLAVLLKPEIFLRDFSIQYVSGKSWESYCEWMKQAIVTFERDLESEKDAKLKEREEKIQQLIEQKRNRQK